MIFGYWVDGMQARKPTYAELEQYLRALQEKCVKLEDNLASLGAELAAEKTRAEAIIAAIGAPLLVIDRTYKVIFQTDLAKENLGGNVGNHCYEAYHNKAASCAECAVTRSWETGKVERNEKTALTPKGEKRLEITASPFKDDNDRIAGSVEIVRDITKCKQDKEDLRVALDRLKKLDAILPICSHCKNIRSDQGSWYGIEEFFAEYLGIFFSHGICPGCLEKHYPAFKS